MPELRRDAEITIYATIHKSVSADGDGKARTLILLTPEPNEYCDRFLLYASDRNKLLVHGQNGVEINTIRPEDVPFFVNALKFAEEFLLKK
ncbi:MAG: hypothetical protein A2942_04775 [Candidatus Lloydbacteria bacterium RIFCSPLOWO2_01_FULL_50_20]|uniref:Uncharacterized protein n=1 Tax=Candidatus Lloydbacteria bacterium RIFCSPLOWO2_01_FULL_50_20 TaxID=1798665 RepID=A0A1G2DH63_9BACT|nr:MAG: hypothetical protein A3C13_01045 [Candidatus Lloydbacteria bacterium RIFCSPHIGHO2_02_FULL_50_11]OGZ12762.1 MAG: hypothetical protein A2942_04775 [Candidatus Lloydbacteria bacterium RIFCSPLOWO2_01_FULL_50_20]